MLLSYPKKSRSIWVSFSFFWAAIFSFGLFWNLSEVYATPVNLLVNGSFEQAPLSTIRQEALWSLEAAIPGWTVTGSYIELQQQGLYGPNDSAPDGIRWAEVDIDTRSAEHPNGQPTIIQDVATIAGAVYELSFFYSVRPDIEWQDAAVFVNDQQAIALGGRGTRFDDPHLVVDGTRVANLAQSDSPQFQSFALQFVGSGLDTIGIGSLFTQTPIVNSLGQIVGFNSPAGGGNLFDNFQLVRIADPNPVPEPISGTLLGVALLGGLYKKRRMKG